jgi:hypothetical protein
VPMLWNSLSMKRVGSRVFSVSAWHLLHHCELMQCVARRIVDREVLRLIRMWLKVPVEERNEKGNRRMTGGKQNTRGTPQGGVISPLLANLYMNRFLKYWRSTGKGEAFQAQVVTYADDFVILSRGHAKQALDWTRQVMTRIGLTLNEAKTSIRQARKERFDFLGYTFGPHRLSERWPLVFGHGTVEEECFTGPAEDRRGAEAQQRTALGETARPDQSHPARLGCVLQPGYAANGIPGRRSSRLHARPVISDSATQGAVARRRPISGHRSVRIVWGAAVAQHPFVVVVVSPG